MNDDIIPLSEPFTAPIITTNHGSHFKGKRNGWLTLRMPNDFMYAINKRGKDFIYFLHNGHEHVPIRHNIDSSNPRLQNAFSTFLTTDNATEGTASPSESDGAYTNELGFRPKPDVWRQPPITLTPSTDPVIATGENLKAQISNDGTPYITYGEHIVLCDAIPMRLAFAYMALPEQTPYSIQAQFTPNGNPYFTIMVGRIPFHVHVTTASFTEMIDNSIAVHASPIAFQLIDAEGTYCAEIDFERVLPFSTESEA